MPLRKVWNTPGAAPVATVLDLTLWAFCTDEAPAKLFPAGLLKVKDVAATSLTGPLEELLKNLDAGLRHLSVMKMKFFILNGQLELR